MTVTIHSVRSLLSSRSVAVSLIIFAFSIAVRIPFVAIPPDSGLYNVDELRIALSVVDRWLGLPPLNLNWPGMPIRFFSFLIFAPEFLRAAARDRSLDTLGSTIAAHYADPSSVIMSLRFLSSLASALTAVAAYQVVKRISEYEPIALVAAAAVTLLPISMELSLTGTSDSVALMFAMWAAYGAIGSPAKPTLVGLTSAAVAATKMVLGIWLVPVFASGAVMLYQREGGSRLFAAIVRCTCAGLAGFVLFYPYLWIDPVRAVKAVLANVLSQQNSYVPDLYILSVSLPGVVYVVAIMVAIVIGIFAVWPKVHYRYPTVVLGLLLLALLTFFLIRGFGYWRYLFGALVPGVVLLAFVSVAAWRSVFALALLAITIASGAIELKRQIGMRRAGTPQRFFQTVGEMCRRGETIWIDNQILADRYRRLPMPKATVVEIASYFESASRSRAMTDWLTAAKVSRAAAVGLQTDFNEDEQVQLARWRAMATYDKSTLNCPFHFFRYNSTATETQELTGYIRGTFTEKSLSDVKANLDNPGDAKVINVVGGSDVLAHLQLPMMPTGDGMSIVTKRVMTK
jgi:hypothetical protein